MWRISCRFVLLVCLAMAPVGAPAQTVPVDPNVEARIQALGADFDRKLGAQRAELEKKIEDAKPAVPWWVVPTFSALLAAFIGYVIGNFFPSRADRRADRQRRHDAAVALCEQWLARYENVAKALGALEHPNSMVGDPELRNIVTDYGNWLQRMAYRWQNDSADAVILKSEEFDQKAKRFLAAFDAACKAVPGLERLHAKKDQWQALQWLAQQAK